MAGAQHAAELSSHHCVDPSGQIRPSPPPTLASNPSPTARVWGAASSPPPARLWRSSMSPTTAPRVAAPAGRRFSTTRQRQRRVFSTTTQRQPSQHDETGKVFEERTALEAKYQKLYEPLQAERYDTVNGVELYP